MSGRIVVVTPSHPRSIACYFYVALFVSIVRALPAGRESLTLHGSWGRCSFLMQQAEERQMWLLAEVSAPSAEARPMPRRAMEWAGQIPRISHFYANVQPAQPNRWESTRSVLVVNLTFWPLQCLILSRAGRILSPVRTIPTLRDNPSKATRPHMSLRPPKRQRVPVQ